MKNKTSRILICAALLLACASLTACSSALAAASAAGNSTTNTIGDDTASKTLSELEAEAERLRAEIEAQKKALAEQEAEAAQSQAEAEAHERVLAEQKAEQAQSQSEAEADIERAKAAALKDAGLTAAEVTFTKAIVERDDGKRYIDVEFYTDSALYEYEIDPAAEYAVHEMSTERFRVDNAQATPAGTIGVARAKEIAAAHTGESLDALVFSKAKLENDDGLAVYELEFFCGGTAYEYTIDATTGDVLESERE